MDAFIKLDWQNILISYMSVPIFLILFIYYKVRYRTHIIPLDQVDLSRSTKGEKYVAPDDEDK